MRCSLTLAAAAAVALFAGPASSQAGGPFHSKPSFAPNFSFDHHSSSHPFGLFGHKQMLPTFQAAPWYLYWPYDAHFQTPAPVFAPYAGPPTYPLPYNPYQPGFANVNQGHPFPGHGGIGWPAIPGPGR